MAQKGPRRPRGSSNEAAGRTKNEAAGRTKNEAATRTNTAARGKKWPPGEASAPARPRREIRPSIYAAFDLAMALVYSLLLLEVSTRHIGHALLLWSTVGAALLAGAGMLWRAKWGWRVAVAGCVVLLAVTVALLFLILLSASFLAGVYGSMGRGGAAMALLAGALVIELVGLLPAFQLKFLLTPAGRRTFTGATPTSSAAESRR